MKTRIKKILKTLSSKVIKFLEKVLPAKMFYALRNNLVLKSIWIYVKQQQKPVSYYLKYRDYPIEENTILYESFYGAGMICNPYAIFKAFMKDEEFGRYKHVWVISEEAEFNRLKDEYKEYSNVVFLHRSTDNYKEYAKYVAIAKYLIQNTSFPFYFAKREDQILVNTWHSVTVKTLGFDQPNGNIESGNMLRIFMQSDYIISANSFMTDIFKNSFKLQGLYRGTIVEEGHPRNDLVVKTERNDILRKLNKRGIVIDPSKKIILYAPTWRGKNVNSIKRDAKEHLHIQNALSETIDMEKYQILIKLHQFTYKTLSAQEKNSGKYVPQSVDTNELLSVVDILISDYSSIFFDFFVTDRPILFYIPDLNKYSIERGIYFKLEELPGPATSDLNELCEFINNIEQAKVDYKQNHTQMKSWACKYDDGNVSHRVVETVFKNVQNYNLVAGLDQDKIKLLFYPGEMAVNGLTEVFLTFVNGLDYDKYDVSIHVQNKNMKNVDRITEKARVFVRTNTYGSTLKGYYAVQYVLRHGFTGTKYDSIVDDIFEREFRRCFGDTHYDYVIDFSGYGLFFATLLSHAPINKSKYIWQHNDLKQDLNNTKKILSRGSNTSSESLLSVYARYDKVVSVGEALMKVNRENISNEHVEDKYTFVNNPVNFERIKEGLDCVIVGEGPDVKDSIVYNEQNNTLIYQKINPRNSSFSIPQDEDAYKFVTIGRLSSEKNHDNLIRAFSRFQQLYPKSILFIIGHGALKHELNQLIKSLDLNDKVILTGKMDNPFALAKRCDCFIFPSLYEGQSIVAMEMRYLKIPIILSNYSTVEANCVPNGQLIIGMNEDDIFNGMIEFTKGNVPTEYDFDGDAYNETAHRQFEDLFY